MSFMKPTQRKQIPVQQLDKVKLRKNAMIVHTGKTKIADGRTSEIISMRVDMQVYHACNNLRKKKGITWTEFLATSLVHMQ